MLGIVKSMPSILDFPNRNELHVYRTVAILVFCVVCGSHGFCQSNFSDPDAASTIQTFLINNSCLKQFDVLVRSESINDKKDTGFCKETEFCRIIQDIPGEKFLFLRKADRTTVQENAKEVLEVRFFAARYVNGRLEVRSTLEDHSGRSVSFAEACKSVELPDVRLTGIAGYPTPFGMKGYDFYLHLVSVNDPLNNYQSGGAKGSSLHVFQRGKVELSNMTIQNHWVIDSKRIVPVTFSQKFLIGEGANLQTIPHRIESIAWTDHDDLMVVESIDQTRRVSERKKNSEGKKIQSNFYQETFYDFHWFAVNKVVFDEKIVSANLQSFADWMHLVDPEKTQAFESKP